MHVGKFPQFVASVRVKHVELTGKNNYNCYNKKYTYNFSILLSYSLVQVFPHLYLHKEIDTAPDLSCARAWAFVSGSIGHTS
jgi:hypothetical protein